MAEQQKKNLEQETEVLIRVLGFDIRGSQNIYTGLTNVKGVSWAISNIVCKKLNLEKTKKFSELSREDIQKIESFLKNLEIPKFLKNRRSDPETGEETHLYGPDLDMKKEFDIKRMKKIKNYKGVRHTFRLPVRGQRTRSHFRRRGQAVGVKRKKK